jgi:serine/threonine-protein kinase
MAWLTSLRTQRAIDVLLAARSLEEELAQQAVEALRENRGEAVPKLIETLEQHGESATLEAALAAIIDADTLSFAVATLRTESNAALAPIARALASAEGFDPNALLPLFLDPKVPKTTLQRILSRKQVRLDSRRLVRLLGEVDAAALPALSSLLHPIAREADIPELVRHLNTGDSLVRLHLVHTLSRFDSAIAGVELERLARVDPHRHVRVAALEALVKQQSNGSGTVIPGPALAALRDEDLVVRNKAIEILSQLTTPIGEQLVELLEDDSEVVRRSAVEVLTRICDPDSVRALVTALRDRDWWVSNRATDALATIGGEPVVEGLLPLFDASEEFLRRTAIEVLQRLDLPPTREHLTRLYHIEDESGRRRVLLALRALPGDQTVDLLVGLLGDLEDRWPGVLDALRELASPRAVDGLLAALFRAPPRLLPRVASSLAASVDLERAREVDAAFARVASIGDPRVADELREVRGQLISRFRHLFQRTETPGGPDEAVPAAGAFQPETEPATQTGGGAGARPFDPASLSPGTLLAERFRVIRQVGSGGFGVVVLVEDTAVHEEIILKFAHQDTSADPVTIERFRGEVRSARRISHDNVVRTHDLVLFGGQLAISMEYFPSLPLSPEELHLGRDLGRSLHIARQICEGLTAAHRVGIVHRDLKPGNVLIGARDHVKIADFGLAAAATGDGHRLTRTGLLMGTPSYMAPEQILGQTLDARTDLYSLGVLFYEIFTGRLPYLEERPMAVLYQHVHGSPTPPRQVDPSIPPRLEAIITRAMSADPAGRYQSAQQVIGDLLTVLEPARPR